jgi:hypothetical protein
MLTLQIMVFEVHQITVSPSLLPAVNSLDQKTL